MTSLIRGTTRDYMLCAVRAHGPLIFVLATATCFPEAVIAVRPNVVMTARFAQEFSVDMPQILAAWERVGSVVPVLVVGMPNIYLPLTAPEIEHDTRDLYIAGCADAQACWFEN